MILFFELLFYLCVFDQTCTSQTLVCNYDDCVNTSIIGGYFDISCSGSYSCAHSTLVSLASLDCYGSMSCLKSVKIESANAWGLYCYGEHSCAFVSYYRSGVEILGCGWRSLVGTNAVTWWHISAWASAYGSESIIHSNVNYERSLSDTGWVKCYSKFGMYNTTINTTGVATFKAQFYGYHCGFNTTIMCDKDSQCNINCCGNSCQNLNIICQGDCDISCDDNYNVCPTIVINNTSNHNTSSSSLDDLLTMSDLLSLMDDIYANSSITWMLNDIHISSILPETYLEIKNNLNSIDYNNNYNNTTCFILCIDESECKNKSMLILISSSNNINICCLGRESCSYNDIINYNLTHSNILCAGGWACSNSFINHNGHLGNVIVSGESGFFNSNLVSFGGVLVCSAQSACAGSQILNGKTAFCEGYESCANTVFTNVTNIFGLGYLSLKNSTINSNGSDINIYLLSYNAAVSLTINCMENDICIVYCQNNGCNATLTTLNCTTVDNDINYNLPYEICIFNQIIQVPTRVPSNGN